MSEDSIKAEARDTSWRYSAMSPRFFCLDARAVFPLGLWILHWSQVTFGIALASIVFLIVLDRAGMPVNACLGYFRVLLVGSLRPAADTLTFRKRSRF
jgi:intracellular multiplication protein IcmT